MPIYTQVAFEFILEILSDVAVTISLGKQFQLSTHPHR